MTLYLGLDLSWTATALVAIREDGSVAHRATIGTEKRDFPNHISRLLTMDRWIGEAIADALGFSIGGHPIDSGIRTTVAIEGYSMGSSHGREMAGELGGAVRMRIAEWGFKFLDVPPTTLKKFVTGKGVAPKEVMLREVYRRWGFDADSNDEADAYALARYAREIRQVDQSDAFKKLAAKTPVMSI